MSESMPEAVSNSFTKKIGPFPGYAYVLIVVVIAYGIYYVKKKQVSTTFVPVDTTGTTAGQDASAGLPSSTPIQAGGFDGTVTTGNGTPASSTNAIWARNAANALIAQGDDPATVSNAIAHYIGGTALSASEQAIVNLAVQQFGIPPQGVIPVNVTKPVVTPPPVSTPKPTPTPKPVSHAPAPAHRAPKPAPPKTVYYTVRSGDNLSTIAQRFYGVQDWAKIYNANRGKIGANPNLIQPNQVLIIPR